MNVGRYSKHYKKQLVKLLNSSPAKVHIWDWQFQENESIVGTINNEPMAFNGIMPIKVWNSEETVDGFWSCDFFVSSDYRGQGFGKQLKQHLIEKSPSIVMSLGISDTALNVLTQMGWKTNTSVKSIRHLPKPRRFKDLLAMFVQTSNRLIHYKTPRRIHTDISLDSRLPNSYDVNSLWETCKHQYGSCVVRDHNYLSRRYSNFPNCNYEYIICRNKINELQGILVFRHDNVSVTLIDYLGLIENHIFKKIVKTLKRNFSHSIIKTRCSNEVLLSSLLSEGFYITRTQTRFAILDKRNSNSYLKNWFLMPGDSDGDILENAETIYATSTGVKDEQ